MHLPLRSRALLIVSAVALATIVVLSPAGAATKKATTTRKATAAGRTFKAEVWADNWFALFIGDTKVGEDSVPITTERSFNAETFTFTATYPLQLRVVAKDYKANDTGLEYIGTDRQQMGDGGLIVQITDVKTGRVVAVTDRQWKGLVIHAAPLDPACEKSPNPQQACTSRILPEPAGWKNATFDDRAWSNATEYTADQIGAKDGYQQIRWSAAAKLIWTADLHVDNTILWRRSVAAPT